MTDDERDFKSTHINYFPEDDEDNEDFDWEAFRAEEAARDADDAQRWEEVERAEEAARDAYEAQLWEEAEAEGKTIRYDIELKESEFLSNEEQREKARQMRRLAMCGRPSERVIGETGDIKHFTYHCGLWRTEFGLKPCAFCMQERADMFRKEALRAIIQTHGTVRYIIVDSDLVDGLVTEHNLTKQHYRRYPGANDKSLLLIDNEFKIGQQFTEKEVNEVDWLTYANTPGFCRTSGKIGLLPVKLNKEDESEIVSYICDVIQITDLTEEQKIEAKVKTYATLIDQDTNPQTGKELQQAVSLFERTYINNINQLGGKVITTVITGYADLSRISWAKEIRIIIQRLDPINRFFDRELLKKPLPSAQLAL